MLQVFRYNLTAIGFLLKNPKLWKHCLFPFFISLFIMAGLIYLTFIGYDSLLSFERLPVEDVGFFKKMLNTSLNFILDGGLSVFKWIIFIISSTLVVWYGYSIVASLVMLPFLEFLSSEVEKELRGRVLNNPWYAGLISSFAFSLFFTAFKLFFLFIGLIFSFIFPPYAFINFFIVAWFCSMESQDLCMSRRLFSVRDKLKYLASCKMDLVSLGSFSSLLLLIPFIGITQPILASISGAIYFVSKTQEFGVKEEYLGILKGGKDK